jgi:septicolysin
MEEPNMKLAEALQERADLNRRIEQLRYRLSNNVLVQEGEKPLEDPAVLLEELESSFTRLEWLIARINLTNCAVKVEGRSLTELIARRDVLSLRAEAYRRLVEEASQNTHRATRTEIKILSAVDVPALQRQADDASRELRLLDNTLQATNWTADLME